MNWLHNPLIETFGKTLLHSLWQFSAIAAIISLLLFFLRRHSSNVRYILCLAALLIMAATPIATFIYLRPASTSTVSTPIASTPTVPLAQTNIIHTPFITESGLSSWSRALFDAFHPMLPFVVVAYLAGALFFSLKLALGYLHVRRLPRRSIPVNTQTAQLFATLCNRLAISRTVQLLASTLVEVPTVLGGLRPIILIPTAALTGMPIEHLRDLLAHELAHVRRHDYLINTFQCVLETLLFYHPAVWWISARIRQEREHCCDDIAVALFGNRLNYAHALAAMESLRPLPQSISLSLVLSARAGALLPRIRRVLRIPSPRQPRRQFTVASSLVALLILGLLAYILGCSRPTTPPVESKSAMTEPAPTTMANALHHSGPSIMVVARIFLIDESTMQKFGKIFPASAPPSTDLSSPPSTSAGGYISIFPATPPDMEAFLQLLQSSKTTMSISSPRLIMWSGQKGRMQIGQETSYISGWKKSPNSDSPLVPVISHLTTGIDLPVEATADPDQKNVLTDFTFTLTRLIRIDNAPTPSYKNMEVQMPVVDKHELSSKILIPDGHTIVILGPKITGSIDGIESSKSSPTATALDSDTNKSHYIVLCIRPTINHKTIPISNR